MALPAVLAAAGPVLAKVGSAIATGAKGIAGGLGSFLKGGGGSILSSLLGGAFGGGGGTDIGSSKELMKFQSMAWRYNTQWYNDNILAHAYKTTRDSLEEAGYNPLIGIGQPLYDQGAMPNAQATSATKSFSMNKLASSQVENINADTTLKYSEATKETSASNLLNQQRETEIFNTEIKETESKIAKIEEKIRHKDYDTYDIRLLNELKKTKAMLINANAQSDQAQAAKASASAAAVKNQIEKFKDNWSIHGPFGIGASVNIVPKKHWKKIDDFAENFWKTNE